MITTGEFDGLKGAPVPFERRFNPSGEPWRTNGGEIHVLPLLQDTSASMQQNVIWICSCPLVEFQGCLSRRSHSSSPCGVIFDPIRSQRLLSRSRNSQQRHGGDLAAHRQLLKELPRQHPQSSWHVRASQRRLTTSPQWYPDGLACRW